MPRKFIPISELITLKGKRAIVTGGAMGIGFAISYRLAEAGAIAVIADVNEQKADEASQKLKGSGYQAIPIRCDVSNEEDVKNMVNTAANKMGGVDILVNNAGIFPRIPLAEMTGDDFDKVIAVNLKSIFLCSREASQRMIEQKKGGCIINLASIDAVHPSANALSIYDASKGAVLTATRSLALELGRHDIRVNAIAPGVILTEGAMSQMRGPSTESGRAQLKALMARMALGRMGEADDIARVALFLASDLASYITGSVIFADGGYLIS
jgi:NAD(P)-dependent dehydrogenase (short-subunit alcohol dehydrogenase family)